MVCGALADDELTEIHPARTLLASCSTSATGQQPQSGVDPRRARCSEARISSRPQSMLTATSPPFVEDRDHRHRSSGGSQQTAQPSRRDEIRAGIDNHATSALPPPTTTDTSLGCVPHVVRKQRQRGQDRSQDEGRQ